MYEYYKNSSSTVLSPTRDRLLLHNIKIVFDMVDVTTYTSCSIQFHVSAVNHRPLSAAFINGGRNLVAPDGYGKLFFWESASANLLWSIESGCSNIQALAVCSLAFSGEFITNTNEDCHHVVFVWQLTRETCTQALDICSAYRSSLEPGLLESELRSQDNHCVESLQPLLYVALARQTCRASSDEDPCIQDGPIPNHHKPTHTSDACKIEELDSNPQRKDPAPLLSSLHVAAQCIPIPMSGMIPDDEDSMPKSPLIMGVKLSNSIHYVNTSLPM
ncbi:uncharacterized protein EDB93DRAFT_1108232 [Suillus bovinus]|uniref:uncharacterized protein n=1 Tax=Suillus bovinus TaxID=48563 RepID=UPI001B87AD0A|nr:uncharacterized protein EDB93DRAFT_1108232 [Suillus bovinus]KAG2130928.1 hypothetical protein EDB93DRAFT_1108232 [Suillus bovinus]